MSTLGALSLQNPGTGRPAPPARFATVARAIVCCATVALIAVAAPVARASASVLDDARAPWTTPAWVAFEHSDVGFAAVAVAIADDGQGLVVYSQQSPSRVIWAASVTPDGKVGEPAAVSSEGVPSFDPKVAIGSGGRAVITWSAGPASARRIEAVTRSGATAAFSTPTTVSAPGGRHLLSDVVLEPGGSAVIAWTREQHGGARAQNPPPRRRARRPPPGG